ncbi:Adaptin ear-binding coat-associated protein 1 [Quillaja saponaria]|uniref:Adaptin ear-binding coat-associated protein 1 n=1 Tax=Quillaja saponaria TaxID=32244 RepID=A0AAD7KZ21_QUISA|nr:Adaptin ear-binding coat-associated protein 1 [Quillaja saponaria]
MEETDAIELVLFQVAECYVYIIPPRKTAASYRYFVLRIEENIGGHLRHAFIGIGFRDSTEAYDFQAALHDHKTGCTVKLKFFEQGLNNPVEEKGTPKEPVICIKPPPPPPAPLSPATSAQKSPTNLPPSFSLEGASKDESSCSTKDGKIQNSPENQSTQDIPDDDFGDFQAAG